MTQGRGFGHDMPFGAKLLADGVSTRFRLWAPAQSSISLLIEGAARGSGPQVVPMHPLGDGWFELTLGVGAGTAYRFELDDGERVPDPFSRFQPWDLTGASVVVDPHAYAWKTTGWIGRPWHEAVLYELHVGTFTPDGSFDGVRSRLDHLVDLGVTAIELMPIGEFAGRRGWGYDGVLWFAPDSSYGKPDELKRLIDEAHARGLMVFLDVVYNHFGPEGNWLPRMAPPVMSTTHHTPWGAALNMDAQSSRIVRDLIIDNALYWLNEYRFDGLRLDAVHAIIDDSRPHVLDELAVAVRRSCAGRHVHLVLENDDNAALFLRPRPVVSGSPVRAWYDAQWNDDWHHAAHVLLTDETAAYFRDYAERPLDHLGRALAEGFAYQGEPSAHRDGRPRGALSADLHPTSFINFLQNHDQIGNRAMGERLTALVPDKARLAAFTTLLLLQPQIPMLFMGEEWGASTPFPFFCDFHGALADAVREGRRREFGRFPAFSDASLLDRIPDPLADTTVEMAKLDWREIDGPEADAWLDMVRRLLQVRAREVVPLLADRAVPSTDWRTEPGGGLDVMWRFPAGQLVVAANFGPGMRTVSDELPPTLRMIAASPAGAETQLQNHGLLPPWSLVVLRDGPASA